MNMPYVVTEETLSSLTDRQSGLAVNEFAAKGAATISNPPTRGQALITCDARYLDYLFPPLVRQAINELFASEVEFCSPEALSHADLKAVTVLFSGWGSQKFDAITLQNLPNLKAVFHAGGSVKTMVTDVFWKRGLIISSAWKENGIPVAEYTLAMILLSLKRIWYLAPWVRRRQDWTRDFTLAGAYKSKVGLVALGAIGRHVAELLQNFDTHVLAFDPYQDQSKIADLNIELVSIEEIFSTCDVISLHAPSNPSTHHLINGELLNRMKTGATLINTARGSLIDHAELERVCRERSDLQVILDVTDPEPLPTDSPLWELPNVMVTPHISGSVDNECGRLGQTMVEECRRFLTGGTLKHVISENQLQHLA